MKMVVPGATEIVEVKPVRVMALTVTVKLKLEPFMDIYMMIRPRATAGDAVRLLKKGCTKESELAVV